MNLLQGPARRVGWAAACVGLTVMAVVLIGYGMSWQFTIESTAASRPQERAGWQMVVVAYVLLAALAVVAAFLFRRWWVVGLAVPPAVGLVALALTTPWGSSLLALLASPLALATALAGLVVSVRALARAFRDLRRRRS